MSLAKCLSLVLAAVTLTTAGVYLSRNPRGLSRAKTLDSSGAVLQANGARGHAQGITAPPQQQIAAKAPGALPENPYAAALREPGKSRRPWSPEFIDTFQNSREGDAIRVPLTAGRSAAGIVKMIQAGATGVAYVSGDLVEPEPGKFFILRPPTGGKAGSAVAVFEFPGSKMAYRVEPTGPGGTPELWERRLDEVVCLNMPVVDVARSAAGTNETAEIPPLRPDLVPDYVPSWNSNIVSLQSLPGSTAVLMLDFFGGYTPTWGGVSYPRPSVSNSQIKDLWKRVAEDYMPFNINVTTDRAVYEAAPSASRMRCVFTPSTSAVGSGAAGVAYIGSWNWGNDTVCWSIYTTGKNGAEVGGHEPGHTLGLGHQGTSTLGYYGGHGSGAVGWAPIMGVGYYQPVSGWARGEYQDANNTEDELNMIVSNNNSVDYRNDDTGATLGTSRYLELFPGNAASAQGVIERSNDSDAFRFETTGGAVNLTASPVGDWANLALMVTLANSNNTVIASNNPQSTLTANLSTTLAAGVYSFRVTGAGRNDPLSSGFSSYASIGYYSVTGSVAGARLPTRFTIGEGATNGTVLGTVITSNPGGNPLAYAIISGNLGGTFAVDNSGTLSIANGSLLNYETLAQTNLLGVQFELFVNITNTVDPLQTELGRRVVVAVTNVNERPTLAGFNATVLEHTRPGALVGKVVGSDSDFYTVLRYSITSGNISGAFAIDSASGVITVAGDMNASAQSSYSLNVVLSDQTAPLPLTATSIVSVVVVTNNSGFEPGAIGYTVYDGITNTTVAALTNASVFPRDPASEKLVTLFEGDIDRGDDYGAVMRGYLLPPATGLYTFWIASDDSSELRLSSSTNPATANVIATVSGYTGLREWTKFGSQQSSAIQLTAGQPYYIEARVKEGSGGDNLAVAWQCTSAGIARDVIPGRYLAPFYMNYIPRVTGFTYKLHKGAINGSEVGIVGVTDVNTNDNHFFALLSGNLDNIFALDTNSGVLRVVNEAALLASARPGYTLQARVFDNGSPQLSNTTTLSISLLASNALNVSSVRQEMWNGIGGGTAVLDLTSHARYPGQPDTLNRLTALSGVVDSADNYGTRIRAILTNVPGSGAFTFYIASDDSSQLKLSSNADPANAVVIASVSGATSENEWTRYSSQKSTPITLAAGQTYYIEALQKEGGGNDHIAVAWAGPGITGTNIIDDNFIHPVDLNYPPAFTNQNLSIALSAANGAVAGIVVATDSSLDTLAYKIISGNVSNAFAIDPATGRLTLSNRVHLPFSGGSYSLRVMAQDSGYAGLFPLKSTEAVVTVRVTGTNWPPAIALLSPTNNAYIGSPVALMVDAFDPDGNLSRVEYFADGAKIGESTVAPYTFSWATASLGEHTLHARAVDAAAAATMTAPITVMVVPALSANLIATGSVWKYLDDGSNQGTAWRSTAFNDGAWKSGRAELGYGDSDEATTVGYGPDSANRYVTTYFRRSFYLSQPSGMASLVSRMKRDDGAVVYLNGSEVYRSNMPTGAVSYLTLANLADDDGKTWQTNVISPAALVSGTNVLAVEIHQNSVTSTDISFDFELAGVALLTNGAPAMRLSGGGSTVTLAWPAEAQFVSVLSATNVAAPTWLPVTNGAVFVNGEWRLSLPAPTNRATFYRLQGAGR